MAKFDKADFQTAQQISDQIIEAALPAIIFDGWSMELIEQIAADAGYDAAQVKAVYPCGLTDVFDGFAGWADRQMLQALVGTNPEDLRVRERIFTAVMARFDVLAPHKEAVQASLKYWLNPARKPRLAKIVWRSADVMWNWAGDQATDYNRYTKRGLLSSILGPSMLVWLNDHSEGQEKTAAFVKARIDNVLTFGRFAGKVKGLFPFKGTA